MKTITNFIIILSLLFVSLVFSQDTETAKVTNFRKGVQAIVGNEASIPKLDDTLPLTAMIECDAMGFLEFEYKGKMYRVNKNTSILLSEVIKSAGNDKIQLPNKTDVAATRALDKKKSKRQKPKNKQSEDK